jgi:hypothetical protein
LRFRRLKIVKNNKAADFQKFCMSPAKIGLYFSRKALKEREFSIT